MKTLEINTYGVQPLTQSEMAKIEGGLIIMAGRLKKIADFIRAVQTIWDFGEDIVNGYKECIN